MSSELCPLCGAACELLIDLGDLPLSGQFLGPGEKAATRRLAFTFCPNCALVRQRVLVAQGIDYSRVDRATGRQLPDFIDEIIDSLRTQLSDAGEKLIVDVGANDGAFLDRLSAAGCRKLLGIEPSHALAEECRAHGHPTVNAYLDHDTAATTRTSHGPAGAVFCRHVLEHVPDPSALLASMRDLLDADGLLFVEVPGLRPVVAELKGHELWDEHVTYFSEANLPRLIARAGFTVLHTESWPHRESQNVLCWARRREIPTEVHAADGTELVGLCRSFPRRWQQFCETLQRAAANWPAPIWAIGASHLQSNFLVFSGLGSKVDLLLDDDPFKAGKYVALPQPVPVTSVSKPAEGLVPGTLLLTAFGYPGWMRQVCDRFASAHPVIVDPGEWMRRF